MDYILNGLDTPYFLSLGKSFKMVMFRNIPMAWFWTLITPSECCVCIFVCGHLCHWKDARATEILKDNTKTLHLASGNGHVQLVYILIQAGGEVNKLPQMVNFCNFSSLFFTFGGQEETFLKFSYIKGLRNQTVLIRMPTNRSIISVLLLSIPCLDPSACPLRFCCHRRLWRTAWLPQEGSGPQWRTPPIFPWRP